jgi:hypothetical protein
MTGLALRPCVHLHAHRGEIRVSIESRLRDRLAQLADDHPYRQLPLDQIADVAQFDKRPAVHGCLKWSGATASAPDFNISGVQCAELAPANWINISIASYPTADEFIISKSMSSGMVVAKDNLGISWPSCEGLALRNFLGGETILINGVSCPTLLEPHISTTCLIGGEPHDFASGTVTVESKAMLVETSFSDTCQVVCGGASADEAGVASCGDSDSAAFVGPLAAPFSVGGSKLYVSFTEMPRDLRVKGHESQPNHLQVKDTAGSRVSVEGGSANDVIEARMDTHFDTGSFDGKGGYDIWRTNASFDDQSTIQVAPTGVVISSNGHMQVLHTTNFERLECYLYANPGASLTVSHAPLLPGTSALVDVTVDASANATIVVSGCQGAHDDELRYVLHGDGAREILLNSLSSTNCHVWVDAEPGAQGVGITIDTVMEQSQYSFSINGHTVEWTAVHRGSEINSQLVFSGDVRWIRFQSGAAGCNVKLEEGVINTEVEIHCMAPSEQHCSITALGSTNAVVVHGHVDLLRIVSPFQTFSLNNGFRAPIIVVLARNATKMLTVELMGQCGYLHADEHCENAAEAGPVRVEWDSYSIRTIDTDTHSTNLGDDGDLHSQLLGNWRPPTQACCNLVSRITGGGLDCKKLVSRPLVYWSQGNPMDFKMGFSKTKAWNDKVHMTAPHCASVELSLGGGNDVFSVVDPSAGCVINVDCGQGKEDEVRIYTTDIAGATVNVEGANVGHILPGRQPWNIIRDGSAGLQIVNWGQAQGQVTFIDAPTTLRVYPLSELQQLGHTHPAPLINQQEHLVDCVKDSETHIVMDEGEKYRVMNTEDGCEVHFHCNDTHEWTQPYHVLVALTSAEAEANEGVVSVDCNQTGGVEFRPWSSHVTVDKPEVEEEGLLTSGGDFVVRVKPVVRSLILNCTEDVRRVDVLWRETQQQLTLSIVTVQAAVHVTSDVREGCSANMTINDSVIYTTANANRNGLIMVGGTRSSLHIGSVRSSTVSGAVELSVTGSDGRMGDAQGGIFIWTNGTIIDELVLTGSTAGDVGSVPLEMNAILPMQPSFSPQQSGMPQNITLSVAWDWRQSSQPYRYDKITFSVFNGTTSGNRQHAQFTAQPFVQFKCGANEGQTSSYTLSKGSHLNLSGLCTCSASNSIFGAPAYECPPTPASKKMDILDVLLGLGLGVLVVGSIVFIFIRRGRGEGGDDLEIPLLTKEEQHTAALEAKEHEHKAAVAKAAAEHEAAVQTNKEAHDVAVAAAAVKHSQVLAAAVRDHTSAAAAAAAEHAAAVVAKEKKHAEAMKAAVDAQGADGAAALEGAVNAKEEQYTAALEAKEHEHEAAVAKMVAEHETAVQTKEEAHDAAVAAVAAKHSEALAATERKHKVAAEAAAAEHVAALEVKGAEHTETMKAAVDAQGADVQAVRAAMALAKVEAGSAGGPAHNKRTGELSSNSALGKERWVDPRRKEQQQKQ